MGRNREFDIDQALDAALCVFWKKGYEGTSYTDLTQATGVERPALYSAFGNKEALFLRVLDRFGAATTPTSSYSHGYRNLRVDRKKANQNSDWPD